MISRRRLSFPFLLAFTCTVLLFTLLKIRNNVVRNYFMKMQQNSNDDYSIESDSDHINVLHPSKQNQVGTDQFFASSGQNDNHRADPIQLIQEDMKREAERRDKELQLARENEMRNLLNKNRTVSGATSSTFGYLTIPFLAINSNAGLGNKLFELISLIGMANSTKRIPIFNIHNLNIVDKTMRVKDTFPKLLDRLQFRMLPNDIFQSVDINRGACCRYENVSRLDAKKTAEYMIAYGIYFQSFKYFHHIRSSIIEWMEPSQKWAGLAGRLLPREVYGSGPMICVHGRRGDFTTSGIHLPSQPDFTRAATEHLVKKYSRAEHNTTVVLLSNDQNWMKQQFIDVTLMGQKMVGFRSQEVFKGKLYRLAIPKTPAADIDVALAYNHCDVVLMTAPASTFGWFLGYLAKKGSGKVYYYEKFSLPGGIENELAPKDFFPPEWTKLRMFSNWTIQEINNPLQ